MNDPAGARPRVGPDRAAGKRILGISRTSAFAFKGRSQDVRQIAQALGVTHVLDGSVRRSGDRVRVTAQLVAAPDGAHVGADEAATLIRSGAATVMAWD